MLYLYVYMHRLSHLKPAAHHIFCILPYCASTAANTSKYANPASNPAGKKASSATGHMTTSYVPSTYVSFYKKFV